MGVDVMIVINAENHKLVVLNSSFNKDKNMTLMRR